MMVRMIVPRFKKLLDHGLGFGEWNNKLERNYWEIDNAREGMK